MKKRKQKTKSKLPIFILIAGGLLILAAAVILILQTGAPQTAAAPTNDPTLPYPNINRVTPTEAQAALDANKAIILDVRAAEAYAASHIAGSISFPETDISARQAELDANQWIITYCTWPSEESSARVAQDLIDLGFKNVSAIRGGFNAWRLDGLPVEP